LRLDPTGAKARTTAEFSLAPTRVGSIQPVRDHSAEIAVLSNAAPQRLAVQLMAEVAELKRLVADQRDEIARLKGLRERPQIKPSGMEAGISPKPAGKRSAVTGRAGRRQENRVQVSPDRVDFSVRPQSLANRAGSGHHPGAANIADASEDGYDPTRSAIWALYLGMGANYFRGNMLRRTRASLMRWTGLAQIHEQLAAIRSDAQDGLARIHEQVTAIRSDAQDGLAQIHEQVAAIRSDISSLTTTSQVAQVLLRLHYEDLVRRRVKDLPTFPDVEFRCRSQNGEDGILLYIFALLGTTNRRVVEICAGAGTECNAANLIINHGWRGLLFDGDPNLIAYGRDFYSKCRTTFIAPPTLVNAWITAEKVNELVAGFAGPVDLLSLDLDGNDYWIWKALDVISPRVVIAEVNPCWGPEKAVAMSYNPDYRLDSSMQPYRCGASLPAFVKLSKRKGYRLVGMHSLNFNAFFVKEGIGEDLLPEITTQECMSFWTPALLDLVIPGKEPWEEV
jgi:hypothetical protein